MSRLARGQLATMAATLGRLEDLAARLEACGQRQTWGRTAFHDALTAVARAVARLEATLHPMTTPPHAAGVALTEALWNLGHQTAALCEAIEQGLQARTAHRPWDRPATALGPLGRRGDAQRGRRPPRTSPGAVAARLGGARLARAVRGSACLGAGLGAAHDARGCRTC